MKSKYTLITGTVHIIFYLFNSCVSFAATPFENFSFKQLTTSDGLSTNDVQQVYQDKDGCIWFATRNGLSQYDGYQIKTYRSNIYNWNLFNNNRICSIAEDADHRLWIGTFDGLNVLDKTTGKITQINRKEFKNNPIAQILITTNNQILLGTDLGLFQYIPERDSCVLFTRDMTGDVMPQTSVKSLLEDSRGNIWIGTWNEGLYRFDPAEGKYFAYPKMNDRKSAHVVFEDSHKRIWVGTWGRGLFLLDNPYDVKKVSWKTFRHKPLQSNTLIDNTIYSLAEDSATQTIWIGTPNGLSVLQPEKSLFTNYYSGNSEHTISGNEVTSLICDRQGMMWIGMLGVGVNMVVTHRPDFYLNRLEQVKKVLNTNSVRCMLVDDEGMMWLGIGNCNVVMMNPKTGVWKYNDQIPGFSRINRCPTLLSMIQSKDGKIWIGTYDEGVFVYDKSKREKEEKLYRYSARNTPWLSGDRVYVIKEDSRGRLWFGTQYGLSMLTPEGDVCRFDRLNINGRSIGDLLIRTIEEAGNGEIWVGTENGGIIRIAGNGKTVEEYGLYAYTPENGKLNTMAVLCLHRDSRNRLWAGTEGCGLDLYDPQKDRFVSVHTLWNLPGDVVSSILSDEDNNLWMGINGGLLKLLVSTDLSIPYYRLYTTSDGLQDNMFNLNAVFKTDDGRMYFGGHKGYNSFYPDKLKEQKTFSPIAITDIKIFDRSWFSLDEELRVAISKKSPNYTDKIMLDYRHNNFSIEFAVLDYINPSQNRYSYRLDGFDEDWQYTDVSRRFAYYNNLKPGKYMFRLRAANSNGIWGERSMALQVVVLPPPWRTWWAYLIYAVVALATGYFLFRMAQNRVRLHNALHLRELEKSKAEELNHTKLQFFTNITHELLTPLTIISAAVDELKITAPQYGEYYQVMTGNINRLIRLLQQILEFRKAETGNLRLKVSKGDLAAFVQNCVDNFKPLMKKRKIFFSIICNPDPFYAYFDSDKMDKILYNLLSNASKYNKEEGTVWVDLSYDLSLDAAVLLVRDNGQGISPEAQKSLFKRFYEGDYRKHNTIGTGIGLSLTKDLVELHGGTISVSSQLGKGTEFKVVIPVGREAYKEECIDDETDALPIVQHLTIEPVDEIVPSKVGEKEYTLLLIEDNEELLHLMTKLLSKDYNVYTACSGFEGLELIAKHDINLIVSDIMMPGMDGLEFSRSIKGNFETSHIPIILLTAKNKEEDRVEAYQAGADAFISKPFNLSVLHARIINLLKTRERANKDFKKQLVFETADLNYTSIDEEFLQKAIACIQRHLDDPDYDQTKFVEEMGTSKSTLFRKLKSLTGLSYSSFVRNIRMKAACRIMEEKKHIRISELAYAVGFNDPKYFSACFKKDFGMHPSEYLDRFASGSENTGFGHAEGISS